jgi:hypothetical protein
VYNFSDLHPGLKICPRHPGKHPSFERERKVSRKTVEKRTKKDVFSGMALQHIDFQ